MPRLLAAERQAALEHFLHHVLVADRAADEIDAQPTERELEADVAHHGGDNRIALQASLAPELPSAHQEHRVAVDDPPAVVGENRAVAVAVERHTHPAAACDHGAREQLRMRRTALQVDVASVGPVPDHDRVEAEAAEQRRCGRRGRAVRTVDRQREAAEQGGFGKHGAQMIEVGADEIGRGNRRGVAALRAPRRVRDDGLDLALHSLGELLALAGKDLDAVVFVRVVGRRDHDARVEVAGAREIGDRRRRHDARARDRGALAARAVRELRLDPGARFARVAAHQQPRRFGGVRECAHERGTKASDGLVIERMVSGGSAHAVGSEQPRVCHW